MEFRKFQWKFSRDCILNTPTFNPSDDPLISSRFAQAKFYIRIWNFPLYKKFSLEKSVQINKISIIELEEILGIFFSSPPTSTRSTMTCNNKKHFNMVRCHLKIIINLIKMDDIENHRRISEMIWRKRKLNNTENCTWTFHPF